jgi:PAS domain S-box-containing protein
VTGPAVATTSAGSSAGGLGALESNESIVRALASHMPLGLLVADLQGNCVYTNELWCELAGLTMAQSLGDGWATAIHPDDAQRVLGEWSEAAQTDGATISEYRLLGPGGGISWIQSFVSAVRDDCGEITGWVGSCFDLTAVKHAGEAATQTSRKLQAAFDSAPIGVALTGEDGRWLDVNDALCELTGYSKEELLALTFAEITHPDDRTKSHEEWVRHNIGAGTSNRIEKRYVRADGEIVWVSVSRTLVRDVDGGSLTVSHIENITGRRNAQRSLEEAEELFRRAFDDAPIGMALVGLDGRWLRANASLCQIVGYEERELLELRFQDLTRPDDLEDSNNRVRSLLDGTHRSFSHEKRYIRKNGSQVWTKLSVSLVRDASDAPLYFIGQIEDIHDRLVAEVETARLLEVEREQVDRLQALDTLKDEFVASVSHELRTPLTSIKGYLELLLDAGQDALTAEQRSHLATIDRNSERLLRLVGDLLCVAQSDAGRLELNLDDLDLRVLTRECVESVRPAATAKRIQLDVSTDDLPSIRADRARLAQLLDNLVSNAVKFTPEGGVVKVSLAAGKGVVVLEVRDSGIGIPAADQGQVFERFFRTRDATHRAIQGTGLGLSIARTIVESHGGQISLESIEDVGTTFRVELPLDAGRAW